MTHNDIIEMARKAGFVDYELDDGTTNAFDKRYKTFAKLVAKKEREKILFAIKELRGRSQEPVAWMNDMGTHIDLNVSGRGMPLYTNPPQRAWVGLTDEEAIQMHMDCNSVSELFDAIESKLKYKNTRGKE